MHDVWSITFQLSHCDEPLNQTHKRRIYHQNESGEIFLKLPLKHKNNIKHISAASSSSSRSLSQYIHICQMEIKSRKIAFIMSIGSNHLTRKMGFFLLFPISHLSSLAFVHGNMLHIRKSLPIPPTHHSFALFTACGMEIFFAWHILLLFILNLYKFSSSSV